MANTQFRKLLHENLNVEVYRVKSFNSAFGISHQVGSIILDEGADNIYLLLRMARPIDTLESMDQDNDIELIGGSAFGDNVMLKTEYVRPGVDGIVNMATFLSGGSGIGRMPISGPMISSHINDKVGNTPFENAHNINAKADLKGNIGNTFSVLDGGPIDIIDEGLNPLKKYEAINFKQFQWIYTLGGPNYIMAGTWDGKNPPDYPSDPNITLYTEQKGRYYVVTANTVHVGTTTYHNGDWIVYTGIGQGQQSTSWKKESPYSGEIPLLQPSLGDAYGKDDPDPAHKETIPTYRLGEVKFNKGDYYLASSPDGTNYPEFNPPTGGLLTVNKDLYIVWDGTQWIKQSVIEGGTSDALVYVGTLEESSPTPVAPREGQFWIYKESFVRNGFQVNIDDWLAFIGNSWHLIHNAISSVGGVAPDGTGNVPLGAVKFVAIIDPGDMLPDPSSGINHGQFLLVGSSGIMSINGKNIKVSQGDWIVWNEFVVGDPASGTWLLVRNGVGTVDGNLPDIYGNIELAYKENKSEKGLPDGYTPLDEHAKVDYKYLPEDINNIADKAVFFKADITLAHAVLPPASSKNNGHYYRVMEEGLYTLDGAPMTLFVNDLILSNGETWFDIRHNVSTVSHKHPSPLDGNIYLNKDDVGLNNVDNTADAHKPVSNPTWTELFARIQTANIRPVDSTIHTASRLVAGLGSDGKLSMSVMPAAMLGAMEYKGSWNADTNDTDPGTPVVPLPPAITANKGYYYIVSVAGLQVVNIGEPAVKFEVGDWVVSDGDRWDRINNTGSVTSVFGRRGDIFADAGDYTIEKITGLERVLGDKLSDLNLNGEPIDTVFPTDVPIDEYVSMEVYKGGIKIADPEPVDADEGDYYTATEDGDYPNIRLTGVKISDTIVYEAGGDWIIQNRGDYYLAGEDGDYPFFSPPFGGLQHIKSGELIVWDGYMWAKQIANFGSGSTFDIPLPTGLVVGNPVTYEGGAWKLANSSGSAMTAHGIIMTVSGDKATVITAGEFKWKDHKLDVGNWYYLSTTGTFVKERTTTGVEQLMLFALTADTVTAFVTAPVDTGTDAFSRTYFTDTIAQRDLLTVREKDRCIVLADPNNDNNGEYIVHTKPDGTLEWLPTGSSTGGVIIPEPTEHGIWARKAKSKTPGGTDFHYLWTEDIDCGTYN